MTSQHAGSLPADVFSASWLERTDVPAVVAAVRSVPSMASAVASIERGRDQYPRFGLPPRLGLLAELDLIAKG